MKYKQIYFIKDVGYLGTYEVFLLCILIVSIAFFIKFTKLSIKLNTEKKEPQATNSLMASIFIFFIVSLASLANILAYNSYRNVIYLLDRKEYKIIEGKINNYLPTKITDKKFESFNVEGIKFVYSPAIRTYSFSKLKGQGNPIEEGDIVRIWYYNSNGMPDNNLILKLEIKNSF